MWMHATVRDPPPRGPIARVGWSRPKVGLLEGRLLLIYGDYADHDAMRIAKVVLEAHAVTDPERHVGEGECATAVVVEDLVKAAFDRPWREGAVRARRCQSFCQAAHQQRLGAPTRHAARPGRSGSGSDQWSGV